MPVYQRIEKTQTEAYRTIIMAFGRIRSKKPDPDDVPPPPPPNMFDPDVIEAADEDVQVRAIVDGVICWLLR